ncbi:52 kDa repressor of the inhibitor of the protein kinase-like, partial [Clarias magur]
MPSCSVIGCLQRNVSDGITLHSGDSILFHAINDLFLHDIDFLSLHDIDFLSLHDIDFLSLHDIDFLSLHDIDFLSLHDIDFLSLHDIDFLSLHDIDNLLHFHTTDDFSHHAINFLHFHGINNFSHHTINFLHYVTVCLHFQTICAFSHHAIGFLQLHRIKLYFHFLDDFLHFHGINFCIAKSKSAIRSDSDEKVADKLSEGLRADPVLQTLPGKWNYEREKMFSSREQKEKDNNTLMRLPYWKGLAKLMWVYGKDHFEESQFEGIARSPTGGKKLKPNAVPTLFNVPNPPSPIAQHTHSTLQYKPDTAESDLKVGDHGYARRQPRAEFEEDELLRAEEDRPCSLCQHYKYQLEQQQQHTARLQRE